MHRGNCAELHLCCDGLLRFLLHSDSWLLLDMKAVQAFSVCFLHGTVLFKINHPRGPLVTWRTVEEAAVEISGIWLFFCLDLMDPC